MLITKGCCGVEFADGKIARDREVSVPERSEKGDRVEKNEELVGRVLPWLPDVVAPYHRVADPLVLDNAAETVPSITSLASTRNAHPA